MLISYTKKNTYNQNIPWIHEAESRIPTAEMEEINISESDVTEVLKGYNNWSTPRCDGLHNYW